MATTEAITERERRQPHLRVAAERLKRWIKGKGPDPRDKTPDKKWDMILDMTREEFRQEPAPQKWSSRYQCMVPEGAHPGGWFVADEYAHRLVWLGQRLNQVDMKKLIAMPAGFQIMIIQGAVKEGLTA